MQISIKGQGQRWISSAEAAKKLGITKGSLANMRTKKRGPTHKMVDGKVLYCSTSVSNYVRKHGTQHNYFSEPSKVVLNWRAPTQTQHST